MKGSGEFGIGSTRGVKAGVGERCRAREGMAIMISEKMWSMVREWKAVFSRVALVRLQCGDEK
jgi:hypothetical protein